MQCRWYIYSLLLRIYDFYELGPYFTRRYSGVLAGQCVVALGKLHLRASVTMQYNLVSAKGKGVMFLAEKVTADLMESNGGLPPGL